MAAQSAAKKVGAVDFTGRTVVVTGGAGGIGRAVSAAFAAAGAAVVIVDRVGAAEAAATLGDQAYGIELDVADPDEVGAMMAEVNERFGGPHAVITLAGGSLGTPPVFASIAPDDLDLVLDVNIKGTFYAIQAAVPYMIAAGGGAIVTCSSIGARQPSPVTGVAYASAKAAIGGMTRKLARELGAANIRVNAIAPGLFLTDRLRKRFDDMAEAEQREVLDAIALRRMPELREIVEPILFLCSEGASFITGITLDVNGGRYLPA
jgi:NAD(P)-dependent dehydrogenase (short-subunit alcohol dehydrogenase family)